MPRPLRREFPGAWYVVVITGKTGALLFKNDKQRLGFLRILAETLSLSSVECHGFCLLKRKAYLIIHTPKGGISQAMRHLLSVYCQHYNAGTRNEGSIFNDRFKTVLFDPNEFLVPLTRLIHQLPVIKRHTGAANKYRWSSYRSYLDPKIRPYWLRVRSVLAQFPQPHEAHYEAYHNGPAERGLVTWFSKKKLRPILGGDTFESSAVSMSKTFKQVKPTTAVGPSMDVLIKSTSDVLQESIEHIITSKKGRTNKQLGRTVAMYLCRHVGHYSIQNIAEKFGVTHPSAVSVRLARFKETLEKSPDIKTKVKLLVQTAGRFRV